MLKLASNNPNPQQPATETKLAAIVARAIMTDSAPASFFGEGVQDEPVKCLRCLREYDDWDETEFIGWHGECVECFMSEDDNG